MPLHSRSGTAPTKTPPPTVIFACRRPLLWPKRSCGASVGHRLHHPIRLFGRAGVEVAELPLHSRSGTDPTKNRPRPSSSLVEGHFCGRSEAAVLRSGTGCSHDPIRLFGRARVEVADCPFIRGRGPLLQKSRPRPSSSLVEGLFCGRSEAEVLRSGTGCGTDPIRLFGRAGVEVVDCPFIRSRGPLLQKSHPRPSSSLVEGHFCGRSEAAVLRCFGRAQIATIRSGSLDGRGLGWRGCPFIRGRGPLLQKSHPRPSSSL